MSRFIKENVEKDGIDRRGFLKCMAWAGTGTLCVMQGGVLKSWAISRAISASFRSVTAI
jgi:3',5'-cyclic-AMP phosphodiesterase